ncbi:MAG: AraC family transcriptional regulator [Lachnospiraceae bacterium]|nr:AraC family transcriptional regulator [Lachnospiraceae bacterium]
MIESEIVIDYHYKGINPVQFGRESCEPGHFFGPSVRTHWLLHYVVHGFGIFQREGENYKIAPGDIFVIPPYMETYYEADEENPWKYIWIGFTTEEELPAVFEQPVIRCAGVGNVFEDMGRCAKMENGRSAFLCGKLWELFSLLLEQGKPAADYLKKALNYMDTEYVNGITVKEVAEQLNLDRSYFSTLFKEEMGIPPQKYLMNLRLEKAAELMTIYDEKPTTAGASVGYPDLYHFSKMFKRHFGISPRQYQKRYREEIIERKNKAEENEGI